MYTVYGKSNDMFSTITRNEMKLKNIPHEFIDVEEHPEAQRYIEDKLGRFRSSILPQVFDGQGNYVGDHSVVNKIS